MVAAHDLGQNVRVFDAGAQALGAKFGDKLKSAGVSAVVFDRGPRTYHGCVKSFADAVRAAGINF